VADQQRPTGVLRTAQAMAVIPALIETARVVEQGEQSDHFGVGAGGGRESQAVLQDASASHTKSVLVESGLSGPRPTHRT
jgi:hypothetical protein